MQPLAGLAIVAAAFPATGRTVRNGEVFVRGVPLAETDTWQLEHEGPEARLAPMLAAAGMTSRIVPGQGKYAGQVGALRVRAPDGREFRIGSGLSDALRGQPPALGSVISYRHRGLHASGLPRFPSFWRMRADAPAPVPAPVSAPPR